MQKLRKLLKLSIYKTLVFNLKYFGRMGLTFPVLVSRNMRLNKCNGKVILNSYRFANITLGFGDVSIFDSKIEKGIWDNNGEVYFGKSVSLGHGTRISNKGKLNIGDDFTITANSSLICYQNINIGCDCYISWECLVMDTDIHKLCDQSGKVINYDKPVFIGNHVWMGCRCTVLKGSKISDDTVVASCSVINKEFDENYILIGGSNKVLKTNINWKV